jgi:hypothetical protein
MRTVSVRARRDGAVESDRLARAGLPDGSNEPARQPGDGYEAASAAGADDDGIRRRSPVGPDEA